MPLSTKAKRALTCDECRRAKRRCDREQPCMPCQKRELKCHYSVDKRSAKQTNSDHRTILQKQRPPVEAEKVMSLLTSRNQADREVSTESQPFAILGGFFGGAQEITRVMGDTHTRPNHLKVHPLGAGVRILWLPKVRCDELLKNHENRHFISATLMLVKEFKEKYDRLWTSDSWRPSSSTEWLYLYSILGIGSTDTPMSSLEDATDETKSLYVSAAGLVGLALIEGTFETTIAIIGFARFSMLIGEYLSAPKFLDIAFKTLVNLGYSKDSVYRNMDYHTKQFRLRYFWHLHTVGYLINMALNSKTIQVLPREEITAPLPDRPEPGHERDCDYYFLMSKLNILSLYHDAKYALSQLNPEDSRGIVAFLSNLQAAIDNAVSEFYETVYIEGDKESGLWEGTLKVMSIVFTVAVYRMLPIHKSEYWRLFEKCGSDFLEYMSSYTKAGGVMDPGMGWNACHIVFMTTSLMVYTNRVHVLEGNEISDVSKKAIDQGLEIMGRFTGQISVIKQWIKILKDVHGQILESSPSMQQPDYQFGVIDVETFLNGSIPDMMSFDWGDLS